MSLASSSLATQWHAGHAVQAPGFCCAAYRRRYVVYAATPNSIAVVDIAATSTSTSSAVSVDARWRNQMRVFALGSTEEEIAFVCGHPERDVVCVGTKQHGLYVTSLTQPRFVSTAKLPRTVTGDVTFSATFLFTEEANYLAFSSLLASRPTDPTPYRLSLWCLDTQALLWRGAMAPLTSMCGFAFDLSFAACQAGRVCLFTVQQANNGSSSAGPSSSSPGHGASPSATGTESGKSHSERNRLVVLSRHCSAVEELQEAYYTCCIASPAEGEDTYLALTTSGYLVAFHATSGSVTRWMDCKVPAASGLALCGEDSLVLTGELTRFFHTATWEFQGKIKLEVPAGLSKEKRRSEEDGSALTDAFTTAVAADRNTLLLFYRSGAMSFYSVEPKAGTSRLSLHRTVFYPSVMSFLQSSGGDEGNIPAKAAAAAAASSSTALSAGPEPQWFVLSSSLWAWWTPTLLLFVSAATGALAAAYPVTSTCATLHPAAGVLLLFDTQRRALVAYGRTQTQPIAEVGVLVCGAHREDGGVEHEEEIITSLASSATGESFYALVSLVKSALPPRLRRYRCGWGVVKKGEVSEKGFYLDCMKFPDSVGNGANVVASTNSSNSSAGSATSISLPAGTHTLLVHSSGTAAEATEGDRVVAVQRSAVVSVGLASHRERASAPAYTHPDPIQRVLACRGGLLVLGTGSCALVQWKGTTSFRWAAKPLPGLPPAAGLKKNGAGAMLRAAVAVHRSDVALLCLDRAASLWQLTDPPRPLQSGTAQLPTAVVALLADVEEATRRVLLWTLSSSGVTAYQLGPVEWASGAASATHADAAVAAAAGPTTPGKEAEALRKTPAKTSRTAGAAAALSPRATPPAGVSAAATPKTSSGAAGAGPAGSAVSPLPLPSRLTPPPPPVAAALTARQAARTPRNLSRTTPATMRATSPGLSPTTATSTTSTAAAASSTSSHTTALAEARRQRRTASARAPSSRQLSERFDELTGFYARQKQENEGHEHPRTPRVSSGATAALSSTASTASARHHTAPAITTTTAVAASTQAHPWDRVEDKEASALPSVSASPEKERGSVPPTEFSTPRRRDTACDSGEASADELNSPQQHEQQQQQQRLSTPPARNITASVVDVSALTVDSQILRSAVAAAVAGRAGDERTAGFAPTAARAVVKADHEREDVASSASVPVVPWSDSPPQRGEPALRPAPGQTTTRADDAVLRSSASPLATPTPDRAAPPPPPPQPHPHAAYVPQVQLQSSSQESWQRPAAPLPLPEQQHSLQEKRGHDEAADEDGDGNSFSSEYFTVQARQLRESLLQLKEMLEQSEMADANSDATRASSTSDTADLDELATLLTTVAAQLHQRQVRRSAESA